MVLEIHSAQADLQDAEVILVSKQDDVGYILQDAISEHGELLVLALLISQMFEHQMI